MRYTELFEQNLPNVIRAEITKMGLNPKEINNDHCSTLAHRVINAWMGQIPLKLKTSYGKNVARHDWIEYLGKQYDAENPEGVDKSKKLKFFRRNKNSTITQS